MKKTILVLLLSSYIYSIFSQIQYDFSHINKLEISLEDDFYPNNSVGIITEIGDGFIYVNHKTQTNELIYPIIKKTNTNLETIDSILITDLDVNANALRFFGINKKEDGGIQLFANGFPNLYVITVTNSLEVSDISFVAFRDSIIQYRKPIIHEDEYIFVFRTLNSNGSTSQFIAKFNSDLELLHEQQLPYNWSFLEGITQSADGNIHLALSTNSITLDSELNIISSNEIAGLAEYEYTCGYQRKTVNLPGNHQYIGGVCQELVQDPLIPWNTLGELRREHIFKYNNETQAYESLFNNTPFGYDFDYISNVRFDGFDALHPDRLYFGSNFYKAPTFDTLINIFSINSVDSTGNLRWSKLFGSYQYYLLYEVVALEDDGVLLIIELWLEDVRNVYYLKLDKDGNVAGTTGIPGLKVYDAVINIAPNPSTDYFQVENLSAWKKNTTIRVVNALGQMVATRQIEYDTEQPKFNTLDWHSGVYYVQVFNDTGLVQTKKVVVR